MGFPISRKQSMFALRIVCGTFVAVMFFFPIYFMVVSSFKPEDELRQIPMTWFPNDFAGLSQYVQAGVVAPLGVYLYNSFLLSIINVIFTVFFSAAAGFGFAKYRFFGKNTLFVFVISTMMIPFQILVVPLFIQVREFGWVDTYAGLIVPGIMNALGVFMMRQFCLKIPDEILEAGRIDGASELRIFFSLVLPLLKPGLASLAIIIFLLSWGNYLWPLVVTQDSDLAVLAIGMTTYLLPYQGQALWGPAMAAATIATLPIALMFLFFQRYFVRGLTAAAVKG